MVPVPACCAPDTAQHNGQFFSAGGTVPFGLPLLPSYNSLVCNPAFTLLVALRYTTSG